MNWQSSRVKWPTLQPRHQPGERDLRRVGRAAEHRFAEEGAAELDAVEPADEVALAVARCQHSIEWAWPAAWRLRVACSIALLIQVSSRSAQARTTSSKARVAGDGEAARAQPPARASASSGSRSSGRIARLARLDPEDVVGVAAVGHREDARGIALQQQARIERGAHRRRHRDARSRDAFIADRRRVARGHASAGVHAAMAHRARKVEARRCGARQERIASRNVCGPVTCARCAGEISGPGHGPLNQQVGDR